MTKARSNATANAAKGDLTVGNGTNLSGILAVGSNGDTIVADSSTATGLRYQPTQAAGKNYLINGGFDIWQRGTSGFTSNAYTADRWQAALNSGTFIVSRSTDVPTTPYFNYSLSMAGTTAQNMQIFQNIESANATLFAGQTVTLSVWAKNSAGTSKLSYVGLYPTAVDNFAVSTLDVQGDLTATSWSGSWTKYSVSFTANALATRGYKIILYRNGTETSTTLFTGIQLEFGSVATAFTRAGGTIQGELAACQRYYYRFGGDQTTQPYGIGYGTSATTALITVYHPVPMRVAPAMTDYNLMWVVDHATTTNVTSMGVPGNWSGKNCTAINAVVASGLTTNRPYNLIAQGTLSSYLGFSAEL